MRMMTAFQPVVLTHFEALQGKDARSAVVGLDLVSPGILHLFERYLDDEQIQADEIEANRLLYLLLALNQYLSLRGLFAESLRWGERLLKCFQDNGWEYPPVLLAHISKAYLETEQHERQIEFAEQVLQEPTIDTDQAMKASLHYHLSSSYFSKGEYETALGHALTAYEIYGKDDEPNHLAQADAAMSAFNALVALKRWTMAYDFARLALHHATQARDPFQTAAALLIKAQAHTMMKQYDEAVPLYEAALEFFTEMHHQPNAARAKFLIAVHYQLTGKHERAFELCRETLEVFRRFGMVQDASEAEALLRRLETSSTPPPAAH